MLKANKKEPEKIIYVDFENGKVKPKNRTPYKTEYDPESGRNRIIKNKKNNDDNLPF